MRARLTAGPVFVIPVIAGHSGLNGSGSRAWRFGDAMA
jgi:hypothetical protein